MRRRRHKWVLVMTWPLTEREARQAVNPDGPHKELTHDNLGAALVYCTVCNEPIGAAGDWCAGEETRQVPLPGE